MHFSPRSRTNFIIWSVTLLTGALLGAGIVLLLSPPGRPDPGRTLLAATVSATQASSNATDATAATQLPSIVGPASLSATATPLPTAAPSSTKSERPTTAAPTAQPTAAPTASPARTPTIAPTAMQEVQPTSLPTSAAATLRRLADAEAALRTGQLVAAIDYGGGNRSSAQVAFDLGDQQRPPRLHITSSYEGTSGAQTVERITISDRSWQRETGGRWTERPAQEAVADQIQIFLPHADSIDNAEIATEPKRTILRWHDAGRDVDATLTVDPATGVPGELRQVTRSTGAIQTVTYSSWNTPVEINPPG